MILWRKGGDYSAKSYTVIVAPGVYYPLCTDFMDGGKPIQFSVEFIYGKTEDLPSNLARFLLDQGLAQSTRLILPS